jgi:organic anion transporter 5A
MLLTMVFFVRVLFKPVKRPYVQLSSPGQTEGLKGGCGMGGLVGVWDGWMGGWVDGWVEGWVDGWAVGWVDGWAER